MSEIKNRNAKYGKNIEHLFANSVVDHDDIMEKIKDAFNIKGGLSGIIQGGVHGEKCDVRFGFESQRNIDANVKAFRAGFNQLTRTSVDNFCKTFSLDCVEYLRELVVSKAKRKQETGKDTPLFPEEEHERVLSMFQPIAKDIVEWSMSFKKSKEILVLFNGHTNRFTLYKMADVLKSLANDIKLEITKKGVLSFGNGVTLQKKGGNGVHIHGIKNKADPKHPGNDIQMKLDIDCFMKKMQPYELASYRI